MQESTSLLPKFLDYWSGKETGPPKNQVKIQQSSLTIPYNIAVKYLKNPESFKVNEQISNTQSCINQLASELTQRLKQKQVCCLSLFTFRNLSKLSIS